MSKNKEILLDCAKEVFSYLGYGLNEQAYEEALTHELRIRGIPFERQRNFELLYKGYKVGLLRADLIINPLWAVKKGEFLVEVKSKKIEESHIKQAQVYMASLNIEEGCVLAFTEEGPHIEEVKKPEVEFKKKVVTELRKEQVTESTLRSIAEEVYNYFGKEILYRDAKCISTAFGVECTLRGISHHKETLYIRYKNQVVADRTFEYVFDDGSFAYITHYKRESDLEGKHDEASNLLLRFGFKRCFLIAFPEKEKLRVFVKELRRDKEYFIKLLESQNISARTLVEKFFNKAKYAEVEINFEKLEKDYYMCIGRAFAIDTKGEINIGLGIPDEWLLNEAPKHGYNEFLESKNKITELDEDDIDFMISIAKEVEEYAKWHGG